MPSRRVLKAAEAIREVVSMAILADLKDPRIEHVTVTKVEVSGDMRQAKVFVSVMGSESKQQLCLHGLQSSAGYLQKKISNRIETRYTPRLEFVLDEGVKKLIEVARILKDVLPEAAMPDPANPDGENPRPEEEPGPSGAPPVGETAAAEDLDDDYAEADEQAAQEGTEAEKPEAGAEATEEDKSSE